MLEVGEELITKTATREPVGRPRLLGRGRSGAVYLDRDERGKQVARKIFHGDRLSALLLYAISGADNPYRWCRDAVRTAVIRRKVLRILVRYWFGDRLRVPRSSGLAWNAHFRAFELHAEFIRASHLPLQYAAVSHADDPLPELTGEIMQPLQKHLLQSGFDGMLWQAGYGNPVAGGNFMLREQGDGKRVWFWIDTESGVPALFALNPWRLVSFYLPRSIRNRSPLFDDVDISKLGRYLAQHADRITDSLGNKAVQRLHWLIGRLADCQAAWKKLNRTERGIACFRSMGRITREKADWFRAHPWRWRLHLAKCATRSLPQAAVQRLGKIAHWYARIDVRKGVRDAARFLVSERYRRFLSRRFITRRLRSWRERQFLTRRQSSRLRAELREEQTALCVADSCVHVAIKPVVKFVEWCVLPLLFVLGVLNAPLLALLMSTGGSIARTAYTLPRCVRAAVVRQRVPWLALLIGLIPFVGTAAYPIQLVYWSSDSRQRLPQFLVYDTFASLGRAVPIWGGENSLLESWTNRLPNWFLRRNRCEST